MPNPRVDKEMVDIAGHILDSKKGHFDPGQFKDQYETALKRLVKRKVAGHTIEPREEPREASNVINLMDALKQSIKGQTSKPAKKRKAQRTRKAG